MFSCCFSYCTWMVADPNFCDKSRHAWSSMLTGACLLHTIIRHQGSPRPTRHGVAWQEPTCCLWGFITLLGVLRYQRSRLRSSNRLGLGQLVAMKHAVLTNGDLPPKVSHCTALDLELLPCGTFAPHPMATWPRRAGPQEPGGRHAGLAVILQIPQACNPELAQRTSQCMAVWATWRPEPTAMKFGQRCGFRTPSRQVRTAPGKRAPWQAGLHRLSKPKPRRCQLLAEHPRKVETANGDDDPSTRIPIWKIMGPSVGQDIFTRSLEPRHCQGKSAYPSACNQ